MDRSQVRCIGCGRAADVSAFISASRCDVDPDSSTPADSVLLNLLGTIINEILVENGILPITGHGYDPVPSNLAGLLALSAGFYDMWRARNTLRMRGLGAVATRGVANEGDLTVIDGTNHAVVIESLNRVHNHFRLLINVGVDELEVMNFGMLRGRFMMPGGHYFVLRAGELNGYGFAAGPDNHYEMGFTPRDLNGRIHNTCDSDRSCTQFTSPRLFDRGPR